MRRKTGDDDRDGEERDGYGEGENQVKAIFSDAISIGEYLVRVNRTSLFFV